MYKYMLYTNKSQINNLSYKLTIVAFFDQYCTAIFTLLRRKYIRSLYVSQRDSSCVNILKAQLICIKHMLISYFASAS